MTKAQNTATDFNIPGVRPAGQERSRKLQDKFIKAGQAMLETDRLVDFSVPEIAKIANSSVGGFYSRFDNKDAFFEFLRYKMLEENGEKSALALDPKNFEGKNSEEICFAFVDLMIEVFSGPWRGVLREAYARIPEKQDSWTPMRTRGQLLREKLETLLEDNLSNSDENHARVSFAVQLLFSALNNELMNPNLRYSISDAEFRKYLAEAFTGLICNPCD